MKRYLFLALTVMTLLSAQAQTAKQVLDKTAAIVGRKGGSSASFHMSNPKQGSTSGTISIKGVKFFASTPEAKVWFDGKTQWAYMASTDEVNISSPTQAEQMTMNPYTFITLYNTGYTTTMKTVGGQYQVHLVAQNKKRTVKEMYITINKNYLPTHIKMFNGKVWLDIKVSNFKAQNQPDSKFRFSQKLCPGAEIIDLR